MSGKPLELPSHEDLADLARENPEAYEALRHDLIDSFIESAPVRLKPRLSGLQFRIDGTRRLSHSALGATVNIYEMMWKSFLLLNSNWQDVVRLKEGVEGHQQTDLSPAFVPSERARILAFRPRSSGSDPGCVSERPV